MRSFIGLLCISAFGLVDVKATVAPLPSSVFAWVAQITTITTDSRLSLDLDGAGGFDVTGALSIDTNSVSYVTGFWCVDDQLLFESGRNGPVGSASVGLGTAGAQDVRYSGVQYSGGPSWTNTSDGTNNPFDSGQDAYARAGYWISQYPGVNTTISSNPTQQAQIEAIQDAVWATTNNNSFSAGEGGAFGLNSGSGAASDPNSDLYWMDQAATYYKTNQGNSDDPPATTNAYVSGSRQTPLKYVTPEPEFYGALALGMGGLLLALWRKRKSAPNS